MRLILALTFPVLILSSPSWAAPTALEPVKFYPETPIGDGNPNAISCTPARAASTRVRAWDCKPNSEWARLHAALHKSHL